MKQEELTVAELISVINYAVTQKKISTGNVQTKFKFENPKPFLAMEKMEELGVISKKEKGVIHRNVLVDAEKAKEIIEEIKQQS